MASLKSTFFVFLLKYRHLIRFRLKRRRAVDWNTSIQQLRDDVEKGAGMFGKLPEGFVIKPVDIEGLNAEWILPPEAPCDKAILYFHGGGLVIGSARSHRGIVSKFAGGSCVNALVFDYALAPEHPYPEGLNDSLKAYRHLLDEGIDPPNIVFMGDSGGGNLCFASLLALKEQNMPLPAAVVALSPWTDLTNSGESYVTNAEKDTLCWKDAQPVFSSYYAGGHDPAEPLISPLFGELDGLPPMLLYAGEDELLRDDSIRLAEKARKAGADVTLRVGAGMFHCYPACAPLFPEATRARDEICAFIRKHTVS